jgi:hypothetical protein
MPPAATPQIQNASPNSLIRDERAQLLASERAQLLVDNWHSASGKLADLHDEVDALNDAFSSLKPGQEILGCRSFRIFCIRHLKRDPSTVYRMMKKARLSLDPAVEEEELWKKAEPASCTAGDVEEDTEDEDSEDDENEEDANQEGEEGAPRKKNKKRPRIDMRAATNAHYADRYLAMIGLLTNAPRDTPPEDIIATIRAELNTIFRTQQAGTCKRGIALRGCSPLDQVACGSRRFRPQL